MFSPLVGFIMIKVLFYLVVQSLCEFNHFDFKNGVPKAKLCKLVYAELPTHIIQKKKKRNNPVTKPSSLPVERYRQHMVLIDKVQVSQRRNGRNVESTMRIS